MLIPNQAPLDIIINIADKVIGATIVKQKAQVYEMRYSLMERRVVLRLQIYPYAANEDGTYGESLAGVEGFVTRSVEVIAANQYLVDVSNNTLIGTVEMLGTPDENGVYPTTAFDEGGPLHGKNVMLDYDFYKTIAASQPVVLDQMITQQVLAANAREIL